MSTLHAAVFHIASEPDSWSTYAKQPHNLCEKFNLTSSEAESLLSLLQTPGLIQQLLSPAALKNFARNHLNSDWVPPVEV